MDLFAELQSEGFADLSTAAFTPADTAGNRFAKTALPGSDLSTKENVVNALAALGEERISCSLAYKIDHDGKKVTVGKADRGTVPADRLAAKWGKMVGAAVAVDDNAKEEAAKEAAKEEKRKAREAAKLAKELAAKREEEAAKLSANGNGQ